ncbi:hypothetical protein TA3x_002433 [Tundrisphaera sp. TA3]|uniref:hypothetical protein n=1 Tax=Tundrisphaera sp. TA3 TaxID=3435775 RepID=UPI003EC057E5
MDGLLTKSQMALRGRDLRDLSVEQIRDWIDACTTMERSVKFNKARRSWRQGRSEAFQELIRRGVEPPIVEPE